MPEQRRDRKGASGFPATRSNGSETGGPWLSALGGWGMRIRNLFESPTSEEMGHPSSGRRLSSIDGVYLRSPFFLVISR